MAKFKQGDIAKWVDYTQDPKREYWGIVLSYEPTTDAIDVVCSAGIFRWLAWQCEVLNEAS